METVSTFGIVGTGIIGAGWAARALASGLDVLAYDPGVDAKAHLEQKLRQIWPVLERTGLHPKASMERLVLCESVEAVAAQAQFIQELSLIHI